jgi:hypothetical protein
MEIMKTFTLVQPPIFLSRKSGHKSVVNSKLRVGDYNTLVYRTIRKHGGWSNWSMKIIEIYPCNNNSEKLAREQYYIDKLNANLNTVNHTKLTDSEQSQKQTTYKCGCGSTCKGANLKDHLQTDKHTKWELIKQD